MTPSEAEAQLAAETNKAKEIIDEMKQFNPDDIPAADEEPEQEDPRV